MDRVPLQEASVETNTMVVEVQHTVAAEHLQVRPGTGLVYVHSKTIKLINSMRVAMTHPEDEASTRPKMKAVKTGETYPFKASARRTGHPLTHPRMKPSYL